MQEKIISSSSLLNHLSSKFISDLVHGLVHLSFLFLLTSKHKERYLPARASQWQAGLKLLFARFKIRNNNPYKPDLSF